MPARFPFIPDYGSGEKTKARINKSQYGDGYDQSSPDGLNHMLREWSVNFNNRSRTEVDNIVAFLKARKGVEAFEFEVPDSTSGEVALVKCDDWGRTFSGWRTQGIQFVFREVPA